VSIGAATEKDNIKILLLGNEVLSLKNGRLTIKVEKAANGLNRLDISTIPEPEFNALIVSQNTTLTTWHE
jgi:phosphopantetheine adenylyltransferase